MGHERWFRGQHDGQERPFDWRAAARQHGVPEKLARALYERAMHQVRGATQAKDFFLALLAGVGRDAARPSPGKVTRAMRLQADRAGKRRRPHVSRLTGRPMAPGARTLTWYLAPAEHERRVQETEREPLESAGLANTVSSEAAWMVEHEISVPGTAAHRRFQADLAAAFGVFDELDALEEQGLSAEPATAVDASSTEPALGDTTNLVVIGWPVPSEAPLTFTWQAREWPATAQDLRPISALTGRLGNGRGVAEPIQAAGLGAIPDLPVDLPEHGSGTEMPEEVRAKMEASFGVDFSSVRIHVGPHVQALGALAYTRGTDIHFAPGRYQPESQRGQELLAHELTHVLQQTRGQVRPTAHVNGIGINHDSSLEQEADQLGARAARGEAVSMAAGHRDPLAVTHQSMATAPLQRQPDATGNQPQPDATRTSGSQESASEEEYVSYPVKVPQGLKTEEELDRYAEVLIFKEVKNWHWNRLGLDVPALARSGKSVVYRYPASFASKHGAKQAGAPTRPAPSSRAYNRTKGAEREAINREIDRQYWAGTQAPEGEMIKGGEQAKKDMWNVYRDQVMDERSQLHALPAQLKELMGGTRSFQPEDYKQLLRIARKLETLSAEDIAVYKMLSLRATDDLDLFEKFVDLFIARKAELKQALENEQKNAGSAPRDMKQAIEGSWQGFDSSRIGTLSEADQYRLAREQTWAVTKAQLEYMKNHPGETAVDFAKTATLMNTGDTFRAMGEDIAEAARGDANAWARWAGGVGAGAKLSGWLLAVGGVLYALSWLTGIGELATIAAFMGAMLASTVVLSTASSELRIKAASQAKTPEEFKEQVTKAAADRTNVIVMLGLLAVALAVRFMAKTYFPETVAKVSRSLAKFREKVRIVGKLSEIKAEFVAEFKGQRQALVNAGEVAKQSCAKEAAALDEMSLDAFIDKLDSGSGDLFQEASVQASQKVPWKALAKTPEGLRAIEAYKAQLSDALRTQAPKEIDAMVKEQVDAIDAMLEKVNKAATPDEFDQALADQQRFLSAEEVTRRAKAREERVRKERAEEGLRQIEQELQQAKQPPASLPDGVVEHSAFGDFPQPGNPKKSSQPATMSGGGHGEANIQYLQSIGMQYNIVHKFSNGVRLGNIPRHQNALKRSGTGQSWFPESWTKADIKKAGEHVIDSTPFFDSVPDGQPVYADYNGVRVGVIKTGGKPATVFPDGTQQPSAARPGTTEMPPPKTKSNQVP